MSAVKKVDYDGFCIDWKNSVEKIYKYRKWIAERLNPRIRIKSCTRNFKNSNLWWNNVSDSIYEIYQAEIGFLESLKDWVDKQYEDNKLTSKLLKMCHEIVVTTDYEAHHAKNLLVDPVNRRTPCLEWGKPHL